MRHFILFSRTGWTKGNFVDPKKAGRLDIVIHCLQAALSLSGRIRKDVVFHAILGGPPRPPVHVEFVGSKLKDFRSDEKELTKLLRKVLNLKKISERLEVVDGVFVEKKSLQKVVVELFNKGVGIFVLREDGISMRKMRIEEKDKCFVLGDFIGLPKKDEDFILRYAKNVVSIGPLPYFASHTIVVVNNELDNLEYGIT